ncbi:hypothetical protein [Priestia megaterium]|uniref:hypothetical protein n=1 Tax=Priestia megaterium TaxID=1404 RepID=UPI00101E1F20|nr:hypothetical protein [Priestia megaterium]
MKKKIFLVCFICLMSGCSTAFREELINTQEEIPKERLPQQEFTYPYKGSSRTDVGYLKRSINQNYTLYVLEGYEFTEEEPRKDVIYNKKNDALWMRIEVFPSNKSVEELNKETKEILRAGFSEVASLDTHLIHHNLEIEAAYKASDDKSNAYGFLVRKQNQHPAFRLTIFAPKSERDLTPFLEMARTLQNA